MKKIIALAVAVVFACALTACSSKAPDPGQEPSIEPTPDPGLAGAWEPYLYDYTTISDEGLLKAWAAAVEGTDNAGLAAVAQAATQVVAGVNHMILAQDADANWYLATMYVDLDGKSEVIDVVNFDMTRYMDPEAEITEPEQLCGGWTVVECGDMNMLPPDVMDAYNAALEGLEGMTYAPIALLGSQVVAGTNYAVLASVAPVVEEPVPVLAVVCFYSGPDGTNELSTVNAVNLTAQPR